MLAAAAAVAAADDAGSGGGRRSMVVDAHPCVHSLRCIECIHRLSVEGGHDSCIAG